MDEFIHESGATHVLSTFFSLLSLFSYELNLELEFRIWKF